MKKQILKELNNHICWCYHYIHHHHVDVDGGFVASSSSGCVSHFVSVYCSLAGLTCEQQFHYAAAAAKVKRGNN